MTARSKKRLFEPQAKVASDCAVGRALVFDFFTGLKSKQTRTTRLSEAPDCLKGGRLSTQCGMLGPTNCALACCLTLAWFARLPCRRKSLNSRWYPGCFAWVGVAFDGASSILSGAGKCPNLAQLSKGKGFVLVLKCRGRSDSGECSNVARTWQMAEYL